MPLNYWPCVVAVVLGGVISAQQSPSSQRKPLPDILARMGADDLHAQVVAFDDLMIYVRSGDSDYPRTDGPSEVLKTFFTRHPDQADSVKLALIHQLSLENHYFIESKSPHRDSHLEDDVSEHYSQLVETVSSLNDERAVPALVGAMTTGGIDQRGLLKYGDKALQPIMAQLKSSDALVRASALDMSIALLEQRGGSASRGQVRDLIRLYLRDPGSVVRRSAVMQIDCLDDRETFVPTLKEIAKTDPLKLPGKALDGGDGDEFYPVRYDARRVLRDIQENVTCKP